MEELEFGYQDQNLAADVDDGDNPDKDEDALDTDEEETEEDEGLHEPREDDTESESFYERL